MHLTPLSYVNEHDLLSSCMYEENSSVLEIVGKYREKLREAHQSSLSTRLYLRLSALKQYEELLADEGIQNKSAQEMQQLIELIEKEFPNLEVEGQGRLKALISWYNKATRKLDNQESIDTLDNDIIAFRLIIRSKLGKKLSRARLVTSCYEVSNRLISYYLGLGYEPCKAESVQDTIKLSSSRLKELFIPEISGIDPYYQAYVKDYIMLPKQNGYQSLHIIIRMPNGIKFEIQIRTEEMDRYAREGYGDHERYKETKYVNCVVYDPLLVKLTSYVVSKDGEVIEDSAGLEKSRVLLRFPPCYSSN